MFGRIRRVILASSVVGLVYAGHAAGQTPSTPPRTPSARPEGSVRPVRDADSSPEHSPARTAGPAEPRQATKGPEAPAAGRHRSDPPAPLIQEPSQGRPIFITPGETFYFVMNLPEKMKGDVSFALRHAQEPSVQFPLKPTTPPSYTSEYCTLLLLVPPEAPAGLYDLEVNARGSRHTSRRCVKVVDEFKNKFRFVHLSNMNVGDPTAPEFDEYLPREVNLLAPEFIVATGDYTEWARAQDDPASWLRVLKYFERFNAPVFMLCGEHDHEASFTKFVASKPIGTIDYGPYHGLLLLDHPGHPIDQDYNQLQWVETDLKRNRQKKLNFLAGNSDELSLLEIWRERGNLASFLKDNKIKLIIAGGSNDWDYKEFAKQLAGLDGLAFVKTHQSSTALRDRATGTSHYRIIEVDGDRVSCVYPDDTATEKLAHSIPVGKLRTYYETPNDGSARRVVVTVLNALNQPISNAKLWLRVAKGRGNERPAVAPGQLLQTIDVGEYWACLVSVDLPDKGAVRVMASSDPEDIPPQPPLEIELTGPKEWTFSEKSTDFGLTYFHCDAEVSLRITNPSRQEVTCWPVIRLNGSAVHPDRKAVPRLPITIAAGKTVQVPLVLDLRRVSEGKHNLQVSLLEDPLSRVKSFEVSLLHGEAGAGS